MCTFVLLLAALHSEPFVVDAEWRSEIHLDESRAELRQLLGSTEFLSRVMPGVTEIRALGPEEFLYRTERSMPFAGRVRTDFRIRRVEWSDGHVVFRSPSGEENYMALEFLSEAGLEGGWTLHARIRVRLTRQDATDIHPFAPLLGAGFVSERMERDLENTLETLAGRLTDAEFDPLAERRK